MLPAAVEVAITARSEVAMAIFGSTPKPSTRVGTSTTPPPIPIRAPSRPAPTPTANRSAMTGSESAIILHQRTRHDVRSVKRPLQRTLDQARFFVRVAVRANVRMLVIWFDLDDRE